MGTAAIAARIPLRHTVPRARTAATGLVFDEPGGPLVAVCGLVGGAGTSTLTLLLARAAAAGSGAPVLLTEDDPLHAGLAVLAGRATPHALLELAQRVADDAAPAETFVELEPGLRLVAAVPQHAPAADPDAVRSLLGEARAAHGLVIVDCGTSWSADSPALAAATHILWSIPATRGGLASARALLDSDGMPPAGRVPEVLVATARTPRPGVSVRALRRLAAQRCERLALIPHSDVVARGERVDDHAVMRALAGLAPTLRSSR
jgi:MinD-like ATPase involved in chromosome partitioning or flagellar assembly